MSKATMDAIRDSTKALQETLYSRNARVIREHLKTALDLNRHGEGPSDRALSQAEAYAEKVDEYQKEQDAEREREEAQMKQEIEEFDLEEALDPTRVGVAKAGFARPNPVECTQRRLFVKVLLRRARAHELQGDLEAAAKDLNVVRRVEPDNREAKQRLTALKAAMQPQPELDPTAVPASASNSTPVSVGGPGDEAGGAPSPLNTKNAAPLSQNASEKNSELRPAAKKDKDSTVDNSEDDDEEEAFDHGATASLLASAADYMKRNDYQGALQIYNYVRRRCKEWESPVIELKVLSNTSLCLQRLRGRLPELVKACTEALRRIEELKDEPSDVVPKDMLLNMECAVLSRRGNAYSQQQRMEESNADATRVRELLGKPS